MKASGYVAGILFVCALQFSGRVAAADLYVAGYGGDIQAAVNAAAPGDTVWVEDGTYDLSSEIQITNAITVRGINGPSAVIIDGANSNRCFRLSDVACTIQDLTVTHGFVPGWPNYSGAGIYCEDSNLPVISNCVIEANSANPDDYCSGGGLAGGTAVDCIIRSNVAWGGGGAQGAILIRCLVEDNHAQEYGGGISGGSATNCIIINNTAIPDTPIVEGSPGGAGASGADTVGCAISGNTTTGEGGGVRYGNHRNSTITANTANFGGGTYDVNELYNCIIWHNMITGSGDGGGLGEFSEPIAMADAAYVSGSDVAFGWDIQYSCTPEADQFFGEGNITNDPVLVSFSHIATNSPCIGAGTNAYAIGVDIDAELWLDPPSMGCDENHGPGSLTGPLDLSISGPDTVATGFSAEFLFVVKGIPTLVIASIESNGTTTNPMSSVEAFWSTPGTNDLILTAFNDTYPGGVSLTQEVVVVSAEATAIHVSDAGGSDTNDGSSWLMAKQTLQAGIDAQDVVGGWVLVADGTYTNELFPVYIDRPVSVQSTNGAPSTVVDAGGMDRCFDITAPGAVLTGFTVQNGFTYDSGAGIFCSSLNATVHNCIIRDNYSNYAGGGMAGGTAVNCHFLANKSDSDGAALRAATAIGCVLAGNEAIDGYAAAYLCELRNCTVVGNHAAYGTGGAFDCDLFNSIVWYNTCSNPDEGENITYGTWTNVCSPDVVHGLDGSITNEPMLASISHLQPGSPCIGAGDAAEALETDIDGEAWLSPPAIGCDEYPGSGNVTGMLSMAVSGLIDCAVGTTADYSFLAIGSATQTVADFGGGTVVTNPVAAISKTWNIAGMHDVVFTAWNDTYPGGTSVTQTVNVLTLEASTIYVALGGSDANDGSSWALAKETIQGGVDAQMVYGGRVLVSNGTYMVTSPVMVATPVQLVGYGGWEETCIDGGNNSQCLYLQHSEALVDGFCITNAGGSYYGGGVRCDTTDPVITNCLIVDCQSSLYGGGGYYGTYIDCVIMSNYAGYGAGLYQAEAIRCTISGNQGTGSSRGGGAYDCDLYHCIIEGNSSSRYGGGVYICDAYSCLIQNNTSTRNGAGGYQGTYYNCTIVSNMTSQSYYPGGGVYDGNLWNCIVAGNFSETTPNNLYSGTADNTCSPDVTHGSDGNITNAPAFVNAANGNYRLSVGSLCIDAGSNAVVMVAVDLDGNARIVGGTVDMGAYEYASDAGGDRDGDGMSDADELIAGTDINNPDDYFRITGVSGAALSWNAVSNRLYSVYWTEDLVDEPFVLLTNGLTSGSFEDAAAAGYTNGFYLIKVELVP
ncbi:choice-of-anchor Q domain-containing protein [Pontiella agarivorans]|uniref:Choice-of-anchor Q domain-containing protein n=1 Tax=Pontiella agarivorans TaxID=3038953 RepID=A0ABU5MUS9_9BACT|nr:choice-of-anchor Q domain-containing protein [Pontiella agarivorans]MDZ8117979.1 choice-of-anchor Q domain-containing protein [Pontiella agarivorans]